MSLFLAIDQSTSATKAILFDEQGNLVDQAAREHDQIYPQPGWVEHDARQIWDNTCTVLQEIITKAGERASQVCCLSITNQRETAVLFDTVTREPVHNALVWQCRRGATLCQELNTSGHDALFRERTGLPIDPYFSASKISHLCAARPDLHAGLAEGRYRLGTIDTYLVYRLTNGAVFASDHTNACRTLLYDIRKLQWDPELCAIWNIPQIALPEIRDASAQFGSTDLDGLLPGPIPICGVLGDSHAALFAHRCFQPGSTKVTFGTGSSIMMNAGITKPLPNEGLVATLAWVHEGVPTYAMEGIVICSGATLAWLRNQLGLFNDYTETEALATELADNGGVYLVPAFSGLGLPYWQSEARATIVGLSGHSDKRHLIRAGLESIAYQLRDALHAMQRGSHLSLSELHGDGGATKNVFLMQFTSDIARSELLAANMPECSALGASLFGMLGIGHLPDFASISALPRDEQCFSPIMDSTQADALVAGWQQAVRQTLCN
jgi:glycerol kinase